MKALTIDDLYKNLSELRKQGLGKKHILISSDDEGNEYHELFYLVSPDAKSFFGDKYGPFLPYGVEYEDLDDYVILG